MDTRYKVLQFCDISKVRDQLLFFSVVGHAATKQVPAEMQIAPSKV